MGKASILLIEDDPDIRELVSWNLGREGMTVHLAESGEKGLALARAVNPDLILLDIMLPGKDGMDVLRELKASRNLAGIPVIMLTARGEDADIIVALEMGAEDHVTKPFSPKVLVARVRARLRQASTAASDSPRILTAGGIVLDPERHEVSIDRQPVELSATEFAVLELLMGSPGRVFSRSNIIESVKGSDYPVTDRSVDVQILGLRKKLGDHQDLVETVRGIGYRFKDHT